jgi:hypothetical protein
MSTKTRKSMLGQDVEIDLIRMKQQLMTGAKTDPTIKREDYVSDRRRRSSSKRVSEMVQNEQAVRQKLEEQKMNKTVDSVQKTVVESPVVDDPVADVVVPPTRDTSLPKNRQIKK